MALQKSKSMRFSEPYWQGWWLGQGTCSFKGLRPRQGAAESSPVPMQQMLSETSSSRPIFLADADRA